MKASVFLRGLNPIFWTGTAAGAALIAAAAFGSIALSRDASAASVPKFAEAPCIPTDNEATLKKAQASGSRAGERSCKDVLKEAKEKVEHRVRQQAEFYYNGCDLDPTKDADSNGCRGTQVPKETCNVLDTAGVPKTFNLMLEMKKNHASSLQSEVPRESESCGDWPWFNAKLSGRTCRIKPDYTKTRNYIEDAYNRGAWIQALNCYHQQVQAEVGKGVLKLTTVSDGNGGEVPGPCAILASDYATLKSTSDKMAKEIQQKFSGQDNIGDIDHCAGDDGKTDASQFSETDPDAGKHRQSACQLRTSRRSLEAMFMQLASCEVWTRAGRSYERFLGKTPGYDEVKAAARKSIHGIKSKKRSMCSHNKVLDRYRNTFMTRFKAKSEAIWNSNSCAPLDVPGMTAISDADLDALTGDTSIKDAALDDDSDEPKKETVPKLAKMEKKISCGKRTENLGTFYRCVLTKSVYDGDGTGSCVIKGAQDGNWSISMSDEGCKSPQRCSLQCVDIAGDDSSKADGSPCVHNGLSGVRIGGCCAVGDYFDAGKKPRQNYGCY